MTTATTAAGFHNQLVRPCLAELFGTLIFAFLGSFSAQSPLNELSVGVSSGLALLAAQTCVIEVSGAHLNPAISISHLIHRNISGVLCFSLICLQLFGAFAGTTLHFLLVSNTVYKDTFLPHEIVSIHGEDQLTRIQAFLLESFLTAIICVVHLRQSESDQQIQVPATWAIISFISLPLIGQSSNLALTLGSVSVNSIFTGHPPLPSMFYLPPLAAILGSFISSLLTFVCREAHEEAEVQPMETPIFSRIST